MAAPAPPIAPARANAGANKWLIAVAVALGALLEIIDTSIVNVALTEMQASLGASLNQMSWVVSSYAVANVIVLPLSAWLGDRFGKKRYFIFSLVGFTLSSVLCGISTSLWMLTVARVLQGLCGGGLLAKAQAILFETFPREEQATAQGFFGAIVIAGPVIGPTLGGYIVTNINWRWIFFINVPVGIAACAMCALFLPPDPARSDRKKSPIDWFAIALLTAGLGSLQTFLEEGYTEDWLESQWITAAALTAVLCIALFVYRVLTVEQPVVDLRVLKYRSLAAGSVLSVVLGIALYGALFALPIFASNILHYTAQQTGLLLLPGALVSAFTMPISAALVKRVDPRLMITIGALILAGSVMWLGQLSPMTGEPNIFWPLVLRSFGTVFMYLPLTMATIGPIPKKDLAASTAFFNLTRQIGGSVGVAILTTILGNRTTYHRTMLLSHVDASDWNVQRRVEMYAHAFMTRDTDLVAAKQRGLALLDGAVRMQASILGFNDTFFLTAAMIIVTLPLVLALGKPPTSVQVDAGH